MYKVKIYPFIKSNGTFYDWNVIYDQNGVIGFSVWGNRKTNFIRARVKSLENEKAVVPYFTKLKAGKLENGYTLIATVPSETIGSFDDVCRYMKNRYNSDSVVTTLRHMQEPKQITKPKPTYDLAALSHYGTW